MFLRREHQSFYKNYGSLLLEQGPAVISDDLNARLKGYLDNDQLLTKLGELLTKYDDGEYELTDLDPTTFGIVAEDRLFVKVDKSDKKAPKFMMWIMNEQFLWGDLDLETAAKLLKAGGEGTSWYEKGAVGAIGSFFSGGGEDSGTDEDAIASVAGAIAQVAAEKGVDPQIYFDKLDEIFKQQNGTTIKDFLETEFSGYAEVVSCNMFRRKIDASVWRGLNIWTILGDVALTIVTFGGSEAFVAGLRGANAANAANKAVKTSTAAKASFALGKGVKAIADITQLSKVFAKLDKARKLAALEKVGVKVGGPSFKWISSAGKTGTATITKVSDDGLGLIVSYGGKSPMFTGWDKLLTQLSPNTATSVLTAAGVNMTAKGVLAAKKAGEIGSSSGGAEDANYLEKGAEVLGYYDTLAADPNAYIENAKQQGASDIASMLLDLKNGSGLFGNTTSQEECSIALLITGLTPDMAKEVSAEYQKIDAKMNVYAVLNDELSGDIAIFAKAYWSACTGEGDDYKAGISAVYSKIKKK
jgi:hypothetical protein